MKTNRLTLKKLVRGQGMTEYIIIVALIAVAAIGTYSYFGKTVRNQSGAMAAALGGDSAGAKAANDKGLAAGKDAATTAQEDTNLKDFTKNAGKQ